MKKKSELCLLTYSQASDILLPERENKMYLGEVLGQYYWIKENPNSYIALKLSGGTPFPVRGEVSRISVGAIIEYENTNYLIVKDESLHIALEKQLVLIKKAVL